jgi:glutamate-1-semialdehyde 2,1-aminomutase
VNRVGSLFSVFFSADPVTNYAGARAADHERFARFFRAMLDEGIYLPPSGFEGWFLGATHNDEDVTKTLESAERAFGT